jgi:hypothetical protein
MVKEAQAGDSLVFFFAGHGGRIEDDGEEEDGYDETICPGDGTHMTDDDLRNILINLPEGVKFTMISGECDTAPSATEAAWIRAITCCSPTIASCRPSEYWFCNMLLWLGASSPLKMHLRP